MKEINEFPYQSRKYRLRYLDEISKLYKDAEHGNDQKKPARETGADQVC
jgi:hypothetical protein